MSTVLLLTSRLPDFAREGGCDGGMGGRKGGREGGVWEGREGGGGWREEGRGPSEARVFSFPPALPHCLLYFLKLYNVFYDNVQSIR